MARRVVGGAFHFPLSAAHPHPHARTLLDSANGLYVNARSALYAIARMVQPERVWLPSYTCEAVVEPFRTAGIEICFYPVDGKLAARIDDVDLREGDAAVLIAYFGMAPATDLYRSLSSAGVLTIEDLSQAVFAQPNPMADYSVYSPRKFFPVPDGGVAIGNRAGSLAWLYDECWDAQRSEQFAQAIEAHAARSLFESGASDTRAWHQRFQRSEALMSSGLQSMSDFTQSHLLFSADWEAQRERRIRNYDYLAAALPRQVLLQRHADDVPLGFPMVSRHRDRIRQRLFDEQVFPPVHWEIAGFVPANFKESHALAEQVMTLPCDARYEMDDLERMVNIVGEFDEQ